MFSLSVAWNRCSVDLTMRYDHDGDEKHGNGCPSDHNTRLFGRMTERRVRMEQEKHKQSTECRSTCPDGCGLRGKGWRWSIFTLAVLIVAGVATTSVLAGGEDAAKAPGGTKKSCSSLAAQGAAGDAEAAAAAVCPVTGKRILAPPQSAAGETKKAKLKACASKDVTPACCAGTACASAKACGAPCCAGTVCANAKACGAPCCSAKAQGAAGETEPKEGRRDSAKPACCAV